MDVPVLLPGGMLFILFSLLLPFVMMAARKNPKRVAAGKKAWRNRGKGSGGKGRGRGRSGGRGRRKPIQRGVVGKVGAFVLGVVPVAVSTVEAASAAMGAKKTWKMSTLSTVQYGFYRWVNNLSFGFFGVSPYESMAMQRENGVSFVGKIGSGIPKGAHLITSGVGLAMMLEDWIASKLAGNRPVKIPMTNYNAIGGS